MVDSGNSYGERVSRLVGWGHWFAFFNIVASMLIGTRYIVQSPWPETLMGQPGRMGTAYSPYDLFGACADARPTGRL